jgi:hypothetical protein
MTERQRNKLAWNNSVELQAMLGVKKYGKKLLANGFGYSVSLNDLRAIENYMMDHKKDAKTITFNEIVRILENNRSNVS